MGKCETKIVFMKNKKQYLPKCLRILAVLLIAMTVLKVAAFGVSSITLGGRIEKAVAAFEQKDESVEKSVSKKQEAIAKLKQKNMFTMFLEQKF